MLPVATCDLLEYENKGTSMLKGTIIRRGSTTNTSHLSVFFKVKQGAAAALRKNPQYAGLEDFVDYLEELIRVEKSEFFHFMMHSFKPEIMFSRFELLLRCAMYLYRNGT